MLYVRYAGDHAAARLDRVRAAGDASELRRLDAAATAAARDTFHAWALGVGGSVVEGGGWAGTVEIPPVALPELEEARRRYATATGWPVSCGVGRTPGAAAAAAAAALEAGGDRVAIHPGDPAAPAPAHPAAGEVAPAPLGKTAPTPDALPPLPPVDPYGGALPILHAAARAQRRADRVAAAQATGEIAALRQRVAGALEDLRAQLPALQQVRTAYPEAYRAVLGVTQQVVELGRQLDALDPGVDLGDVEV